MTIVDTKTECFEGLTSAAAKLFVIGGTGVDMGDIVTATPNPNTVSVAQRSAWATMPTTTGRGTMFSGVEKKDSCARPLPDLCQKQRGCVVRPEGRDRPLRVGESRPGPPAPLVPHFRDSLK
jgi:hypothetical protein